MSRPPDGQSTIGLGRGARFVLRYRRPVTALVVAASIVTCVVLRALAGGSADERRLSLTWWLLPLVLLAHVLAYTGYLLAHHQVVNSPDRVAMGWRRGAYVAVIGFGAWLVGGGFAADRYALRRAGLAPAEAAAAVTTLGMLEMGLLAPTAFVCGLLLIAAGAGVPGSVTLPWVAGVPVGLALVLTLLSAPVDPWTRASDGSLRHILRAARAALVATIRSLWSRRRGVTAVTGIAVYWAADIAALGLALRCVSLTPSIPRLVIAYTSGYFLTRRTLPFAGVIVTETLLTISLGWVGLPLAPAAIAVLIYRLSDFTLTLSGALVSTAAVNRILRRVDADGISG